MSGFSRWLALREAADAAARAPDLLATVQAALAGRDRIVVHDLGCGTGSMARWLAPRLPGTQHWILYDRDPALLAEAARRLAGCAAADGAPVTVRTRRQDITTARLDGADLVTASALLDMLTAAELDRVVAACAGHPTWFTLSVTGQVALAPPEPLDAAVRAAFNAHQRRTTGGRTLLGPDAADAAVEAFTRRGIGTRVRDTPWRLGADQAALAGAWFAGWVRAAAEQEPALELGGYTDRRTAQLAAGVLAVTVAHQDVLAGCE